MAVRSTVWCVSAWERVRQGETCPECRVEAVGECGVCAKVVLLRISEANSDLCRVCLRVPHGALRAGGFTA
jgi:hypothetical protein